MSNQDLEKKWKEALLGIGLATASPSFGSEPEMTFDPKTLHHDLHPIAHLESSYGKNMAHKASAKGELDTAIGPLGLKPTTAHDEYTRSPALQKLHPNLKDIHTLLGELKANPQFYNNVAASHWNRLKKQTGTAEKAAFAWRYGPAAAAKTPEANILKDKYVQSYAKMANPDVKKSEDLEKAIGDLKPGFPTWRDKNQQNKPKGDATKGFNAFNYDHLLEPHHISKGYSMTVNDNGEQMTATVHHGGKPIAWIEGRKAKSPVLKDSMHLESSTVISDHRGQGLGTAAYEALYTHAKHKAGIKTVFGGIHSSMANTVHQRLSQKHGLNYHPEELKPTADDPAWDNRYGEYKLQLSELSKAIGDLKPGNQIFGTEHPTFDYSHILSPEHRAAGYSMQIEHTPKINAITGLPVPGLKPNPTVSIHHPKAAQGTAGILEADHRGNIISPAVAEIPDEHQGKGLGQAMYEALYAHGKHVLGAAGVSGDAHSTMASRVHQKLSVKHGLGYVPTPNKLKSNVASSQLSSLTPKQQANGSYDAKFGPYAYNLKYDDFDKNFEEWLKKK